MEEKKKVIKSEEVKTSLDNHLPTKEALQLEEYINTLSSTTEETYKEELTDQVEAGTEKSLYEIDEERLERHLQ